MSLNNPAGLELIPIDEVDCPWVRNFIASRWGSPEIVVHGVVYLVETLQGCKAVIDGYPVGLITWNIEGDVCEIVSLDSLQPRCGIGGALLKTAEAAARSAGCRYCMIVTTNDNLSAQQFYTSRGYHITRIDRGAVNQARIIKPAIPLVNKDGVPITDEIFFVNSLWKHETPGQAVYFKIK